MKFQEPTGSRHPTACRTCRRRGRKCDKLLPTCQSCKVRGSSCEGYVTRWPGVAARGKLAGRAIPVESSSSPPENRPASSSLPRGHSVKYKDRDYLSSLVDYYAQDLGTIIYIGSSPSDNNPYLNYIIPLARTDPCLRLVIAASASCHLAARFQDKSMGRMSRELRVDALKILRQRMNSEPTSTDVGTLATILMMIQLDMCSGECVEFETHLPVARLLACSNTEDLQAHFFQQRLAWLDIMRSTTSSHLPTFTSAEIKSIIGHYTSPWGREWCCDVFPCPIELFEYIADATMLYKQEASCQPFPPSLITKATLIIQRVSFWHAPQNLKGPKLHLFSAYHAAVMLYITRLFGLAQGDAISVLVYRDAIFEHVEAVPEASSWSYSMLWPILQAGFWLAGEDEARRQWVRELLNSMTLAVGCRHFGTAREALDFVWKNKSYFNSITVGELETPLIIS